MHPICIDNTYYANCSLIVRGNMCNNKHFAKFCCETCVAAGLLPVNPPGFVEQRIRRSAMPLV